jgi:hypothetical protein
MAEGKSSQVCILTGAAQLSLLYLMRYIVRPRDEEWKIGYAHMAREKGNLLRYMRPAPPKLRKTARD